MIGNVERRGQAETDPIKKSRRDGRPEKYPQNEEVKTASDIASAKMAEA